MKQVAPIVAVVVLAGALAVVVYFATRTTKPADPPVNGIVTTKNADFKIENFMFEFDHDSDGKVTFEEFNERYGKGTPPLLFTEHDGAEPLNAPDAFKKWDRNKNGFIDSDDIRQLQDKEWVRRAEAAARRGLKAVDWKGLELELNPHQLRTFDIETGAVARGELPFANTFWKAEHLAGRWSRVKEGEVEVVGYVSERNGRVFALTETAEMLAKDPAKVEILELPADDPHMLYAAEIAKVPFDNPKLNLELARKCKGWGMKTEAGMLYARVLVFDRANAEALAELGYRLEGDMYVGKGE